MKRIERKEIFKNYDKIRFLVSSIQKVLFDGNYNTEDEKEFDALKLETTHSKNKEIVLRVESNDINSYSKKLSEKLKLLLGLMKTKKIIIISSLKIDLFVGLYNKYHKVKNAYSIFLKYIPEKSYKEAIELNINEIDDFVEIFFWLTRCVGNFPEYVWWFDENQKYCFNLCNNGNIHLTSFLKNNLLNEENLLKLGFLLDDEAQFDRLIK